MAIIIGRIDKDLEGNSTRWANWQSRLAANTCGKCYDCHGSIVDISVYYIEKAVCAHFNCYCIYVPMRTVKVGTATSMGFNGADAYLMFLKKLPNYYISKK